MANDKANDKARSRQPANTAFRQQRLKAWQPILTPRTVLPLFFLIGVIFAPIGGLLLLASSRVQQLTIDYTDCYLNPNGGGLTDVPEEKVSSSFSTTSDPVSSNVRWRAERNTSNTLWNQTICTLEFTLPNDMPAPVYYYYRLTNFYQNHRRYVKSLDESQLSGHARDYATINAAGSSTSGGCAPLIGENNKPYYPCGLIANSYFNDSIFSPVLLNPPGSSASNETYFMTDVGIAWPSDKHRFKPTAYNVSDVIIPPNWGRLFPNGYAGGLPDLQHWEALQVWMRTAGLPTFSKLALRNDTASMRAGTYSAVITDNFPVIEYGGTKSMVITTTSVIGGKNEFLGIAYLVVGGLCIFLGTLFTARHLIKPRKLGDHTYLSWNSN